MVLIKFQLLLLLSLLVSACEGSGAGSAETVDPNLTSDVIIEVDIDQDGFSDAEDCDDNNQYIHALKIFYIDNDLDGFGSLQEIEICALIPESGQSLTNNDPDDNDFTITPLDQDGDGTLSSFDCNDQDSSIALTVNYYADTDDDGYGAGAVLSICSIQPPTGYVLSNTDPDDSNASIVPDDSDGDGIANTDDCAPNDSTKYVNQVYYADDDGDNLGSGDPVNICVSSPIPALANYSLVAGDSCPNNINSNKDFDEDNIDDVCDQEIRVLNDKIISGDDLIYFSGAADGSKTFYFGANNNPVMVEFAEGSSLYLGHYTTLNLEGGSKLVLNKTLYNKKPRLSLSERNGLLEPSRIVGMGDNNKVELYGALIFLGDGNEFDNIEQIYVTTKQLYDPVKEQDIKYRTQILYSYGDFNSSYFNYITYHTDPTTAPTIKNSPGRSALYVYNQTLEVGPIKFLNNKGYPIQCVGDDTYKEEGEYYLAYSACQYAIFSRYEGNLFNGPLLEVSYTEKSTSLHFRYNEEMPSLNIGTKDLYIKHFSIQSLDNVDRAATFQNLTLKAAHSISKDINGDIIDMGFPAQSNSIPFFRVYNPGFTERTFITFYDTDLREVPIIIEGGGIHSNNSQMGIVLFPNLSGSNIASGSFTAINNTTLDFANSPYVVSDGTNSYGIGLPSNFAGYVVLGRDIGDNPTNTEDTIISDSSLRYPIIDTMPMSLQTPYSSDLITASNFRLTKSVDLIGTDVGSVFGQDSSVNSLFLKIK